ncbi:MAG: HmuY family protein [Sphingomonadales bacterium]
MRIVLVITATALLCFGCTKEKTPIAVDSRNFDIKVSGSVTTVRNLPADTIIGINSIGQPVGSGRYSFFSLEKGQWVPNTDSASTRWDLAFAGTTIRVNNQTSGPGLGGAFVQVGTFESLVTISTDSVFRIDNHPVSYAIPRGSGRAWYTYDGPTNLLTTRPGRVLVIRTATGKFAKVEILNYYRGGITPSATAPDSIKIKDQRFLHFRYTFQANGSGQF